MVDIPKAVIAITATATRISGRFTVNPQQIVLVIYYIT